MFKKIVTLLLVAVMVITLVACSSADQNNDDKSETKDKQEQTKDENKENGNGDSNEVNGNTLTQVLDFLGFTVSYADTYSVSKLRYGSALVNDDYIIVVISPSLGFYDNQIAEVSNIPEELETFVLERLGDEVRAHFTYGYLSQTITKQTEKNINGIKMAITEGTLYNEQTDTTMNCSAAYMFGGPNGDSPVCILGFSRNGDGDVKAAVDTIIENIKKN